MKGKVILLISPEPWGANFVSKHHYANYLAKENTVYFLNPAHGFRKKPFVKIEAKNTTVHQNLTVINYVNLLPRLNTFPRFIQRINYKLQAKLIRKHIGEKLDIVWSFDPLRYWNQQVWGDLVTIYHTVDFHPAAKYEKEIILSSTHFLGVADLILDDFKAVRKGVCIPHAADLDGFSSTEAALLPGKNSIRACYVGNFHRHIDYGVLLQMANENTQVDFILIGPVTASNLSIGNSIKKEQLARLENLSNVHFIGSVPPKKLMSYIQQCSINLVLFKKEHERLHCSPHKLMGYFYSGNVTLANYIDAHKNTPTEIIQMVNDQGTIPDEFKKIVNHIEAHNTAELTTLRKQYALANGYADRILAIEKIIYFEDNQTHI